METSGNWIKLSLDIKPKSRPSIHRTALTKTDRMPTPRQQRRSLTKQNAGPELSSSDEEGYLEYEPECSLECSRDKSYNSSLDMYLKVLEIEGTLNGRNQKSQPKEVETKNSGQPEISLWITVGAVVAVVSCLWFYQVYHNVSADLREEIRMVKDSFPSQDVKVWSSFASGINKTYAEDPNRPSIFLLLHKGDPDTPECLAEKVGEVAIKFLNEQKGQKPVIIDGSDLKNNKTFVKDYGEFTNHYKQKMNDIGVMIVKNLQEIPGKLAQTFHTFCDEVNPLVKKAVYLFTLRTDPPFKLHSKDRPMKMAEETLSYLWKDELDTDIMDPLIVRMTSEVLIVNPEKKVPCSSASH